MVNVPPVMSFFVSLPSRALLESSRRSWVSATQSFSCTSRTTGTTSPLGVSTAMPMLTYFLRTTFFSSLDSDEFICGNCCSAVATAFITKTSRVNLMPDSFSASAALSFLRSASRSVTSTSSHCVTWGMRTQFRCRFAPVSFLILVSFCSSVSPNWPKSTSGQGSSPSASPAPPPASRMRSASLT